jgi:hypothetical protein
MPSNRRRFLSMTACALPLAVASMAVGGTAVRAAICDGSERLPLSQKNRRRGLDFKEVAPDAKRECRGCAFFTPGEGDCGHCMMLDYTVNAGATCASFTAREE